MPKSRFTVPEYIEGLVKGWIIRHPAPEGTVWVKIRLTGGFPVKPSKDWAFVHDGRRLDGGDWNFNYVMAKVLRDRRMAQVKWR